jgi:hypothetical protein
MKKLLMILGLPMLLSACQSDDILINEEVANGDGNVSFTLSIPDMMNESRATDRNSAAGGITNVDMSKYDLRYQLSIYRVENGSSELVIDHSLRTVSSYQPVTYSFNLTPGKTYKAVVWADFVEAGEVEDLHYDTSDFYAITDKDGDDSKRLNDESRDAFFVCDKFDLTTSNSAQSLTLTRPFAKLRIVTTDWNKDGVINANKFKLTYKNCWKTTEMDIITCDGDGDNIKSSDAYEATIPEEKDYTLNYDAADNNRTVIVDYLMMYDTSEDYVQFELEAYDDDTLLAKRVVDTDIPVRRNWLTTVLGNLQSTTGEITVECTDQFDNEVNIGLTDGELTAAAPDSINHTYYISNAQELLWLSQNASKLLNVKVVQTADIDLQNVQWSPINTGYIGNTGGMSNIAEYDGKSHTIYNLYYNAGQLAGLTGNASADYEKHSRVGLFGSASAITIKNVKLQNVGLNYVFSYAGGLVGELGACGGENVIANCSVSNLIIRPMMYYNYTIAQNADCGGLVGIANTNSSFINCTADNVDILCGWRAGGLVGFVNFSNNGDKEPVTFSGCYVSNSSVWNFYVNASEILDIQMQQCGALAGRLYGLNGEAVTFSNCSSSNITYKYLGYTTATTTTGYTVIPLYQKSSGDEGKYTEVTYQDNKYNCGAATTLYGVNSGCTVTVE